MPDSPTQSLIVRLPADKARRIVRIVDRPDSAYESVDEFIRVAVENQLTMEGDLENLRVPDASDDRQAPISAAAPSRSGSGISTTATAVPAVPKTSARVPIPTAPVPSPQAAGDLLRRPAVEGLTFQAATPTTGQPLSSFTNRLTPLLGGPRVLANLSTNGSSPSVDQFLDVTAKASRALGLRLRAEDDAANRRGRHRRSTAWPVGDDESKSLIRYRNCFMFMPEKKVGFAGPLLDLQLVAVVDGKVFLTNSGAPFATALSPAIDESDGVDLLGDEHRHLLAEAIIRIPGEFVEISQFLAAVESASGSQDEIDKELGVLHSGWSEAQVVSHRAALVGRLRDLAVIDVETDPKTMIVPGSGHAAFIKLLSAATQSA
jgi:hypothetical protein